MKNVLLIAIALTASLLAACASFGLRDANDALNSYYAALQQSSANDDWRMAEESRLALDTLAQDSAAQAEKEKDARNKIAFYRVATVAAWQSGSDDVIAYAGKGQALCDAENNASRLPRDCAMLKVIPTFASVDQATEALNELSRKIDAATDRSQFIPAAEQIFADYRDNLSRLLAARPQIVASPVHPDFVQALDDNLANLLCNKLGTDAVGVVAQVRGNVSQARCEVWRQKLDGMDKGLEAHCLPASGSSADLAAPEDC